MIFVLKEIILLNIKRKLKNLKKKPLISTLSST